MPVRETHLHKRLRCARPHAEPAAAATAGRARLQAGGSHVGGVCVRLAAPVKPGLAAFGATHAVSTGAANNCRVDVEARRALARKHVHCDAPCGRPGPAHAADVEVHLLVGARRGEHERPGTGVEAAATRNSSGELAGQIGPVLRECLHVFVRSVFGRPRLMKGEARHIRTRRCWPVSLRCSRNPPRQVRRLARP